MIQPHSEIFLLRHGETEWNAAGRFQGKLDSALTEQGVGQVSMIGKLLAEKVRQPDAFFASPLGRVRQTTSIVRSFAAYPDTIWDARLEEVSIGSWDGLTHIDIESCWPRSLVGTDPFDWFFRSPDGESYESAVARVRHWLSDLNGLVVAISHGLLGRIIRGTYLGLSKEETLRLPVPHDVIWRLTDGSVEAIK